MNNFNPSNLSLVKPEFYLQKTEVVAKMLLGKIIKRTFKDGVVKYYKIVETEAYLGVDDPVCHSYKNRLTARTKPLYLSGGAICVYLIYGLHFCLNVVTKEEGDPQAVLIRALEPLTDLSDSTNGPGKLGKALELNKELNGEMVFSNLSPLQIFEPEEETEKVLIKSTPRIGVDLANRYPLARLAKLRFFIKDNPFVTKHTFNKS